LIIIASSLCRCKIGIELPDSGVLTLFYVFFPQIRAKSPATKVSPNKITAMSSSMGFQPLPSLEKASSFRAHQRSKRVVISGEFTTPGDNGRLVVR